VNTRLRSVLTEIWLPILLVAAWWMGSASSESVYFPPLATIVDAFRDDWLFARIPTDLVPSLQVLALGYGLALVVGIGVGVLLGLARRLEQAVRPLLELLRAVPGVALLPILIVVIGIDTDMKMTLVAAGAVWPILLNTIDGVRGVEPVQLDVASAFRLGRIARLRFVVLPSAAPQIFAGARTALAIAVVVMVVGETVGSTGGIGYFLLSAQRDFAIADMWGTMIALGIVGYLLNVLFRILEGVVLRWHRLHRFRLEGRS
jgi:ABC-type nitrate/sulfonate/bicarbonate transport system permease component